MVYITAPLYLFIAKSIFVSIFVCLSQPFKEMKTFYTVFSFFFLDIMLIPAQVKRNNQGLFFLFMVTLKVIMGFTFLFTVHFLNLQLYN
jgi:hypothetical protein